HFRGLREIFRAAASGGERPPGNLTPGCARAYEPLPLNGNPGRLAQRESTPFTRAGSQVQSLHRPPAFALRASAWQASLEAKRKGWLARPKCGRAATPKPGRAKAGRHG